MKLYELNYTIPDMHFANTMIRFEHIKPELTLIDFGLVEKLDKKTITRKLIEQIYELREKHVLSVR